MTINCEIIANQLKGQREVEKKPKQQPKGRKCRKNVEKRNVSTTARIETETEERK